MRATRFSAAMFGVAILTTAIAVRAQITAPDTPPGFPRAPASASNPVTREKAELGRHLFYDTRLSENGTQSCASCHKQELAFTDGLAHSVGSTGIAHPRGSMSLINVAYASNFTWVASDANSLESQARVPMFGAHPVELGLRADGKELAARLQSVDRYRKLFAAAFPTASDPFTIDRVIAALATFERTIVSARSPYDAYHFGDDRSAVSPAARRGEVLFFSQPFACFTCHGGANFTSRGLHDGFKAPTLRNIAVTGPYMHDGRLRSLEDAILHNHPGLALTPEQRADFLAFLDSLTDKAALTDPRWANPWR